MRLFKIVGIALLTIILIILVSIKLYLPSNSILLETTGRGRTGNQLFQYSAAYSLAKQTGSKLYLLVDKRPEDIGYVMSTEGEYALGDLNIPTENIIYKNRLNKLYFKILYKSNSEFVRLIKKILFIRFSYVYEDNFFRIARKKKNGILLMKDWFESPIFFGEYKQDLLEQFKFNKLGLKKLQPMLNEVSLKNSVCVHIRRGDMVNIKCRLASIDFQKQSIKLAEKILDKPQFFIFSDDSKMVSQELKDIKNLKFIDGNSPTEDLYLMSQCANNIITKSSFSWWAAYLNQNNGLVIAPYHFYNESFFRNYEKDEERYMKRALYARAFPKDWVLLDEDSENLVTVTKEYIHDETVLNKILAGYKPREFNIYTGDRIQLDICKEKGDFRPNLCILNNELPNHIPTVVTAYYEVKNKYKHADYTEWAQNFLQIPFNLIVYTDKANEGLIRKLRGNLPMVLIEKNLEDFEAYKLKNKYDEFAERDSERNPKTGDKYHSSELYMIWAEKIKFTNDAIKLNPYKSNFFVWCDIGVFRDKKYIQENFSNDRFMIQDKMSIVIIKDIENKDRKAGFINSIEVGLQGGIKVGDIRAWQVYDYLYDITRKDLMDKDILSGKDQTVITTMAIRYPELFNIIYQDPRDTGNRWWYGLLHHSAMIIDGK